MSRFGTLLTFTVLLLGAATSSLGQTAGSVTYEYDDAGRLKGGTFSDGPVVQYQYDPAGNRTTMTTTVGVPAQLSIALASASEGSNVVFQITKTGTWASNITVECAQTNGTAIAGGSAPQNDYTNGVQVITFLAADPSGTQRPCTVATINDTYYEGTQQTFNGILQNVSAGGVIGVGSAVGTINDNDTAPSFSVAGDAKSEGTSLSFTITKSGLTELSHDISWASADGSAMTADSDYTSSSGSQTFTWNTTSFPVAVATTSDSKYENAETLALNLSNATGGATIGTASATGTINNDDAAPTISINDPAAVTEGGVVTFTVTKSGSTQLSHSVNWSTANGTAVAPGDYTSVGSTAITFGPTTTSVQAQVTTIDDSTASEPNETLFVNLATNGATNGATISDAQGVGTIADNDGPPGIPASIIPTDASDSDGEYPIIWSPPTAGGAVSYYELQRDKNDPTFSAVPTPAPTIVYSGANTFYNELVNPAAQNTWYYRVRACNGFGCSGWREMAVVDVSNGA